MREYIDEGEKKRKREKLGEKHSNWKLHIKDRH